MHTEYPLKELRLLKRSVGVTRADIIRTYCAVHGLDASAWVHRIDAAHTNKSEFHAILQLLTDAAITALAARSINSDNTL
jgi:hypothetical protein